ncbi:MAG TPA: patatin-like phospholipase family protein [Alphaproteobacteria bacterium]|nr:patatin-like phospholipase family protein [Alphaproteobacteria bacterium]
MNEIANVLPTGKTRPLALVLQGGGALGAFQVGAYQALHENDLHPNWIAGTSIGAINAAIIAGNPLGKRLERLESFWSRISTPDPLAPSSQIRALRQVYNFWSAQRTALTGQPGFFTPRPVPPYAIPSGAPGSTSYYDTSPLKSTLERLVDFDRINAREVRLSLGAVRLDTGQTEYFDNHRQKIGPEHVMASGALPPAFPAIEIDGIHYWDGGVASNTPIETILDMPPHADMLILVVDLWDPRGHMPENLTEVEAKLKNVTYASRAAQHIHAFEQINRLRRVVHSLYMKIPPEARDAMCEEQLESYGCPHAIDILHLVYRSPDYELASKDYEFSASSVARHRAQGYAQAESVLVERGWCAPASQEAEVRIYESKPLPAARKARAKAAESR